MNQNMLTFKFPFRLTTGIFILPAYDGLVYMSSTIIFCTCMAHQEHRKRPSGVCLSFTCSLPTMSFFQSIVLLTFAEVFVGHLFFLCMLCLY